MIEDILYYLYTVLLLSACGAWFAFVVYCACGIIKMAKPKWAGIPPFVVSSKDNIMYGPIRNRMKHVLV